MQTFALVVTSGDNQSILDYRTEQFQIMSNHEFNRDKTMSQLQSNVLQALPPEQHAEIAARFDCHAPLLISRLEQLYGGQPGFKDWLSVLMLKLGTLLAQRPADLRRLDRERAQHKDWFLDQKPVGYCGYVERMGGTLNGVRAMIPYLQELGITYLHLLPFLRAREGENDGGFAVASFAEIEPALGSMQDLAELASALRAAGISLCSDFILNHVADTHPWASAARHGDSQALDYFCTYTDQQQVIALEGDLNQVFPEAAPGNFSWDATLKRWVWTTFYPYQWDLNYANPEVFANMVEAMLNLANQGVEVFRLDSTAYIWKRPGTNCMNQPEVHWILQAMRSIVEFIAPGTLLKAEAIVATRDLPAYLGGAANPLPECQMAYHSTLMAAGWAALASQNVDLVNKVIQATPSIEAPVSWLTYVRCHDDIGWNVLLPEANLDQQNGPERLSAAAQFLTGADGGFGRGVSFQAHLPGKVHGTNGMTASLCGISAATDAAELELGIRRMLLLYGLACSFGGMPLIYMGDELAQENDHSYLSDPQRMNDSRWLQRPFLDQAALQLRHVPGSVPGRVFGALCHMLKTRRQLPELAANATRTALDSGSPCVVAFARGDFFAEQSGNDGLLFLGNFSDQEIPVDLAWITGSGITGSGAAQSWINMLDMRRHSNQLILPPWSQSWLKPDHLNVATGEHDD